MTNRPLFKDTDPKIRAARDTAYKYLHIMLKGHGVGEPEPPRTLAATLTQELLDRLPNIGMAEAMEKVRPTAPDVTAKPYDPEQEVRKNKNRRKGKRNWPGYKHSKIFLML
jgi:hypothetical protein